MITFEEFLLEKNLGVEYENKVKKIIRKISADFPDIKISRTSGKGAMSAHDTDLVIKIDGKDYNIEIKKDAKAQMGGFSARYDDNEFELTFKEELEDETKELILETLKTKTDDIDKVINWFKKNDPVFKYNKNEGYSMKVSPEKWKEAISKGITKPINVTISYNEKFISQYYNLEKNTYYIQIGELGLFYLDKNPLNLDIPKFKGEIQIEFRAGKSGNKYNKTNDYDYATIALRLQGRMLFKGSSTMTLDNETDVRELFTKLQE